MPSRGADDRRPTSPCGLLGSRGSVTLKMPAKVAIVTGYDWVRRCVVADWYIPKHPSVALRIGCPRLQVPCSDQY
jgi:hypothetical protein